MPSYATLRGQQPEVLLSGVVKQEVELLSQDQNRGDSAVVVKRLEDQIRNLQREINIPSQEATSITQLTNSSSSP